MNNKLINCLFLLCFCINVKGQIIPKKEELLDSMLRTDKFDSIVIYNKNEVKLLEELIELKYDDTISFSKGWYSESNIDPFWAQRNHLEVAPLYVSLKIKAFYWAWLIYRGKYDSIDNIAVLVDLRSKKGLFDYGLVDTVTFRLKKINSSVFNELQSEFDSWLVLVKEKGLKYVQEMHLSPLKGKFYFRAIETHNGLRVR